MDLTNIAKKRGTIAAIAVVAAFSFTAGYLFKGKPETSVASNLSDEVLLTTAQTIIEKRDAGEANQFDEDFAVELMIEVSRRYSLDAGDTPSTLPEVISKLKGEFTPKEAKEVLDIAFSSKYWKDQQEATNTLLDDAMFNYHNDGFAHPFSDLSDEIEALENSDPK